uniref:Uncharacterized protein n=1 Tax=Cacopsylla melanoneura TaxID=428564 RepID=A0A8D9ED94_9HEMI
MIDYLGKEVRYKTSSFNNVDMVLSTMIDQFLQSKLFISAIILRFRDFMSVRVICSFATLVVTVSMTWCNVILFFHLHHLDKFIHAIFLYGDFICIDSSIMMGKRQWNSGLWYASQE